MKKKSTGLFSKILLILVFFVGVLMMYNIAFVFVETERIEGVVEHIYMGKVTNGVKTAGGAFSGTPMCRVVWYDKDGEEVVYGMPNDNDYEVGDSYFLEVDVETNRIPKRPVGECVVATSMGLIICIVCVFIWRKKFRKIPEY